MIVVLTKSESEDESFVHTVQNIINKAVVSCQPEEIYVVKIDNWFDHKWLEFSGKTLGLLGVWLRDLRIPPFVPDRVIAELHFKKIEQRYELQQENSLHIYQASEENALRKIKLIADSAIFIWYSANTNASSQASFMFYQVENDAENAWYASFVKKESWQLNRTRNISRSEVLALLD